jgi:hypothetical protein
MPFRLGLRERPGSPHGALRQSRPWRCRLGDPPPSILDDPFALVLVGSHWRELPAERRAAFGAQFAGSQTRAGIDWREPTLFSWLGVALYLTTAVNKGTLNRLSPEHAAGNRVKRRTVTGRKVPAHESSAG